MLIYLQENKNTKCIFPKKSKEFDTEKEFTLKIFKLQKQKVKYLKQNGSVTIFIREPKMYSLLLLLKGDFQSSDYLSKGDDC